MRAERVPLCSRNSTTPRELRELLRKGESCPLLMGVRGKARVPEAVPEAAPAAGLTAADSRAWVEGEGVRV